MDKIKVPVFLKNENKSDIIDIIKTIAEINKEYEKNIMKNVINLN